MLLFVWFFGGFFSASSCIVHPSLGTPVLLFSHFHSPAVADVQSTTKEVIRRQYSAVQELVRHMWALFPITTPQQEEKGARIAASLMQWNSKVSQLRQGLPLSDAEV